MTSGKPSTLWASYLNLFVAAAGAGLLSFPYAVCQQGAIVNLVVAIVAASLTLLSDFIILQSAYGFRYHLQEGTLESVAAATLGTQWARVTWSSIVFGVLGALIGYLIVVGDMLEALLRPACAAGDSVCLTWTSRGALVPILSVGVALPLSSVNAISSLAHSSFMAAATVLIVGAAVVVQGAESVTNSGGYVAVLPWTTAAPLPAHDPAASASPVVLLRSNILPLMLGIPIVVFSLGNHVQVVPIWWEACGWSLTTTAARSAQDTGASVHDDSGRKDDLVAPPSLKSFPTALYSAVATCFVLYYSTGISGYLAYRDSVAGDVLTNLPSEGPGRPLSAAAQALLAIHVLMAYPVLLYPARLSLHTALCYFFPHVFSRSQSVSDEADGGHSNTGLVGRVRRLGCDPTHTVISAVLVALTTAAAVAFPQVSVVFGLVGAIVATYQIYALPGALLWQWSMAFERIQNVSGSAMANTDDVPLLQSVRAGESLLGMQESGGGPPAAHGQPTSASARQEAWTMAALEYKRGLQAQASQGKGAAASPLHSMPLWLLSTQPMLLRLLAVTLSLLFVTIGGIGTGTYVYSTWLERPS